MKNTPRLSDILAQTSDADPLEIIENLALGHTMLGWESDALSGDSPKKARPAWLYSPEAHSMCIAPTGGGKGRSSLIPQLIQCPGSALVIDVKGEAAMVTSQYRKEVLGHKIVILDPCEVLGPNADSLNPLDARKIIGDNIEDFALGVPEMLHSGVQTSHKERFWDNQADSLLSAVACGVLATKPQEERTFAAIVDLLLADDATYALAQFLDVHQRAIPESAYRAIAAHIQTVEVTRSGILSAAQQHLKLFASRSVRAAFAKTSFSLEDLRDGKPVTIYLVLPPTKLVSHSAVLRSWLTTLLRVVMSRKTIPKLPTTVFVDELAQLGSISDIETAFTLMRGYGLRMNVYLQDLQQLKRLYPRSWRTMVGNSGALQIFRPNTRLAAKELRKLFPKEIRTDDILKLKSHEQLVLTPGGEYQQLRKLDYLRDPWFAKRYSPNPYYEHRASNN